MAQHSKSVTLSQQHGFTRANEYRTKVVELFCGAGGFSALLPPNMFHIVSANDFNSDACASYLTNHPDVAVVCDDIANVTAERMLAEGGDIDLVLGGPSCQGFSTAGAKRENDPRNGLWEHYLRLIDEIRPKMFVFENVVGFKTMYGGRQFSRFSEAAMAIGYSVDSLLLNALDYGIPQSRRRLIVVGKRDAGPGWRFDFPIPTGHEQKTVRDAFAGLSSPTPAGTAVTGDPLHAVRNHCASLVALVSKVPPGGDVTCIPISERPRSFLNSYGRLSWDEPSGTVTRNFTNPSGGRFIHPTENRGLTLREGARLQSFPDEWVFHGGRSSVALQIGNAVPPKLGLSICMAVRKSLRYPQLLQDESTGDGKHPFGCKPKTSVGWETYCKYMTGMKPPARQINHIRRKTLKKILLVEPGYKTEYPPLGLMKLSSYHKSMGDSVQFIKWGAEKLPFGAEEPTLEDHYDTIHVTSLFTYSLTETAAAVQTFRDFYPDAELRVGGILATLMPDELEKLTGVKPHTGLLPEVENFAPDYSLFPGLRHSISFTTRGCIRKCGFCAVTRHEPEFFTKDWIKDIDPKHRSITFWDNNWLASPNLMKDIETLKSINKPFDFNQGLDCRLWTDDIAEKLSGTRINPLRFSWDHAGEEEAVVTAIETAQRHGFKDIRVYVLYNNGQDRRDTMEYLWYRLDVLNSLGVSSFPMRFSPLDTWQRYVVAPGWDKGVIHALGLAMRFIYHGIVGVSRESFVSTFGTSPEQFVMKMRMLNYEDRLKRPNSSRKKVAA
ncbi:MAG: DNA (cytosine-5-)-methyltransferase [Thermodesulfovibrionales bacterium]